MRAHGADVRPAYDSLRIDYENRLLALYAKPLGESRILHEGKPDGALLGGVELKPRVVLRDAQQVRPARQAPQRLARGHKLRGP